MQIQTLSGNWQVRQSEFEDWIPACVPGGVHTDLMAAGRLPDPFYGLNEEQVQWVGEKDWVYRRFFYPQPSFMAQEHIFLVCDGLDTLADVRLNGQILGTTDNMFRRWEWEIKSLLREGENRLEIHFHSPLDYIRLRDRVKPMGSMAMGIRGGQHLRKTPSHFGWDWGPRLPCIGIWKEVRLEGRSQGRLLDVRFDQKHDRGMVTLFTRVHCELWTPVEPARADTARTIRLRVTGPDREVWQADAPARPQQSIPIAITQPKLWWPHDLGEQSLYRVEVDLLEEDRVVDSRVYQTGLRTVELRQEEDEWGKSFQFVVNGVPIFAKGANWIPADSFPTRVTRAQVEHLLRSAVETHQNMLRVWGGGYYESDEFYELCDRYGILVWQDFQFACATYPLDDAAYLDSVRCEVIENVRRLRHHPSLVLWCGNNEIEWMMVMTGWRKKYPALGEAYQRFFFQQLPELLNVEDPERPYWPSSPSSNDPFNAPNHEKSGDAHLWEVYHMYRPPRYYRQQNPRFVSEFGFQSLPGMSTVERFASAEERSLNSKVMKHHQRAMAGNPKLVWYLSQRFRLPKTFEEMVYISQVFQAEAVRAGVEHWRRQPERTAGALYWQLNDCWPVISWAGIDYGGGWKALQYVARHFFAPVMLSLVDHPGKGRRKVDVWLTNDTAEPWQGELRWTLETLDGEMLKGGKQTVRMDARAAGCLINLDFAQKEERAPKIDWHKAVFVAELWQGDARREMQVLPFVAEKNMPLDDAGLTTQLKILDERLVVQVHAKRLARFVALALDGAGVIFSDNFFDLPAGRTVTVDCQLPEGWTEEQARQALKVRWLGNGGAYHSGLSASWNSSWALIESVGGSLWSAVLAPALKRR